MSEDELYVKLCVASGYAEKLVDLLGKLRSARMIGAWQREKELWVEIQDVSHRQRNLIAECHQLVLDEAMRKELS